MKGFGNSVSKKKAVKRKTPMQNVQLIAQRRVGEVFTQLGLSRELGEWIYQGVRNDIQEDWTPEQMAEWCEVGKAKYGFKPYHYELVDQIVTKMIEEVKNG